MLKIASLNCRRLAKVGGTLNQQQQKQKNYIRYLRSMHFDILALQDTKIPNTNYEQLLSNQFHAHSCHWSTYCGLVCFSPNIIITPLLHTLDGRGLLVTVSDINSSFKPFYIFNIYVPAPDQLRYLFFLRFFLFFNPPLSPSYYLVVLF